MIRSASIRNFFLAPFALWALLFVAVPLIVIAWYGVTNDDGVFSLSSLAMITRPGYFKALIGGGFDGGVVQRTRGFARKDCRK